MDQTQPQVASWTILLHRDQSAKSILLKSGLNETVFEELHVYPCCCVSPSVFRKLTTSCS